MTSKAEELAKRLVRSWREEMSSQSLEAQLVAALREYGAEVRKQDAEAAENASPNGFDIGAGDGAATVFEKTRKACAAALEREELP